MFKKILFPIEIQEPDFAKNAFSIAVEYAQQSGASIRLLSVVPAYNMPMVASFFPKDAMEKSIRKSEADIIEFEKVNIPDSITSSTVIRQGRPYEEIVAEANEYGADLVVIPSHNHQGLHGVMLGSCADKVAEHAECSVLIVRK